MFDRFSRHEARGYGAMKLMFASMAGWVLLGGGLIAVGAERGQTWVRHVIDGSSRGADGARLADANGDGLPDIATAWEEGGQIRVCLHPGPERVREPWPSVTVGRVDSPEDAVFADINGDGVLDVVSSCEGGNRSIYVHFAPSDAQRYLDATAWRTEKLPAAAGKSRWMFCLPMEVDGRNGTDLVAGSKNPQAAVVWLQAPGNGAELDGWRLHPVMKAGWIMSLAAADMDGDGQDDLVVSDRKGDAPGVYWLRRESDGNRVRWTKHAVGGQGQEVMFLDVADLNSDGANDIVVAVSKGDILFLRRSDDPAGSGPPARRVDIASWSQFSIPMPEGVGTGKSVRVGDINLDGRMDLVLSCENAAGDRSGLVWMEYGRSPEEGPWQVHALSGRKGVKFDLVQLVDLDGDGDLDVITCEERENLGLIWYENPTRAR